eukprot:gene12292-25853_t
MKTPVPYDSFDFLDSIMFTYAANYTSYLYNLLHTSILLLNPRSQMMLKITIRYDADFLVSTACNCDFVHRESSEHKTDKGIYIDAKTCKITDDGLKKDDKEFRIHAGVDIPSYLRTFSQRNSSTDLSRTFHISNHSQATLTVSRSHDDASCFEVNWSLLGDQLELEDCIALDDAVWYGGPELFLQRFASSAGMGNSFKMQPFISSDIYGSHDELGGALEAHWINSNGWSLRVTDITIPLWISFNDDNSSVPARRGALCLRSDRRRYPLMSSTLHTSSPSILRYSVCSSTDIGQTWQRRVLEGGQMNELTPSQDMLERPVWSTWAEFKKDVNQTGVLAFAKRIRDSGLPYSVLEIDDKWSAEYGDFKFNKTRFPDAKGMVRLLKGMGFAVMVWVTPFCDVGAVAYSEGVSRDFWVRRRTDNGTLVPARVSWWDNDIPSGGSGSVVLDVSNPMAREWFVTRLQTFLKEYGVDGVKLDAGETVYFPTDVDAVYHAVELKELSPLWLTSLYSPIAHEVSDISEVRAAWRGQRSATFVRVMDLDSVWGFDNGLRAAVTRVLSLSVLGYRFVLPDMIGGNGYGPNGDIFFRGAPPEELYIRWLQMNLILPMQLSIPPWRYNSPTVQTATSLVFALRDDLMSLYRSAISDTRVAGLPLVRPLWWATTRPSPRTLWVEDQFLVGDSILMAPVLCSGCSSKTVQFPEGSWIPCNAVKQWPSQSTAAAAFSGPASITLKNLSIFDIPSFVRADSL